MADIDTGLVTNGPLGHSITATLRQIIASSADTIRTALGLGTAATTDAIAYAPATGIAATALAGGFAKHALVAGAAAGDVTVTGIKTGDELDAVLHIIGAGVAVTDVADLTSEFTITATNKINNTGGTASSGDKLMVLWTKRTA